MNSWNGRTSELRPVLKRMLDLVEAEDILRPQAAYGYWRAAGEGNDIVLFDEDGKTEVARFALPRQNKEGGLCIADFLRDIGDAERDVIGLQLVTMGGRASDTARQWFADEPLSGLSLSPRPFGRDGRGACRIHP